MPSVLRPGTRASGLASPLPQRVQCSSPKLLVGPGRPSEAQDTAALSFQPKHPPPFRLEKCANDPGVRIGALSAGILTEPSLHKSPAEALRRRWQLTLFAKCQRNG